MCWTKWWIKENNYADWSPIPTGARVQVLELFVPGYYWYVIYNIHGDDVENVFNIIISKSQIWKQRYAIQVGLEYLCWIVFISGCQSR